MKKPMIFGQNRKSTIVEQNKKTPTVEQNKNVLIQNNKGINNDLLKQNANIKKSQFSQFLDKENRQKKMKPMNALINYKANNQQKKTIKTEKSQIMNQTK